MQQTIRDYLRAPYDIVMRTRNIELVVIRPESHARIEDDFIRQYTRYFESKLSRDNGFGTTTRWTEFLETIDRADEEFFNRFHPAAVELAESVVATNRQSRTDAVFKQFTRPSQSNG